MVYENPVNHDQGVYAIPADVDDRALFYNKDLLKRGGYVDANGEARPPFAPALGRGLQTEAP